jgi:hypothetical protein
MKPFTEFQKALPFRPNKIHYPCIGQPKINGGRCGAAFDNEPGVDLFAPKAGAFKLHSKEDIDFPVQHIKDELTQAAREYPWIKDLIWDGEIYQRGLKVATINGAARNQRNPVHDNLQYIIFDCITANMQMQRIEIIKDLQHIFYHGIADLHQDWPLGKVIILESIIINNDQEAKAYRDIYLKFGFEGIVLREMNSFYTPGKHVDVMYKYKQFEVNSFLVVDLQPKPIDDHLPLFICKNDLTDDTFECVPMGTHNAQAAMLKNKHKYIDTYVDVKYYERTINNLPFNANVLPII